MIPPYELKKKSFTASFRGYSKEEVDEHLNFVIEKYTELYRGYDELEKKLAEAQARLTEMKKNEDAIRHALVDSQAAASKIINEANAKSEMIAESTKQSCERIIKGFRDQVKIERDTLNALRAQILEFKNRIFNQYHEHIQLIESITPNILDSRWSMTQNQYTAKVLSQIKLDVGKKTRGEEEEEKQLDRAIQLTIEEAFEASDKNKSNKNKK